MKQSKQASIASFFAKPGQAKLKDAQQTKVEDVDTQAGTNDSSKRKRLKKTVEDTPEAAKAQHELEDALMDDVAAAPAGADGKACDPAASAPSTSEPGASTDKSDKDQSDKPAAKPAGLTAAQKDFASRFKQPAHSPAKKGTSGKAATAAAKPSPAKPAASASEGEAANKPEPETKPAAVKVDAGADQPAAMEVEAAPALSASTAPVQAETKAAKTSTKANGQAAAKAAPKRAAAPVKPAGRPKGKSKVIEEEEEEDDPISEVEEESEDEIEDDGEEEEAGAEGAEERPVKRLKRSDDTTATKKRKAAGKKGAAASTLEGVGTGALEAALKACDADIASLARWKAGEPVPYAFLADTFEEIANETKRLIITSTLTNCFRAILATTPEDLLPAVYMCVNRVAPAHFGIELGVGESTLIKALAESTGRKEAVIKKEYEAKGDLGVVAVSARTSQRTMFPTKPLTIRGVFQVFKDIAAASGTSSQERKKGYMIKLLAASKGNEAGYIARSLQAKLRIGLAEQSVLLSLAHAVVLHKEGLDKGKKDGGVALAEKLERAAQAVKAAYCECPSYDVLVPALLAHGLWELPQHCHFMPSVPIKPMLAKPTNGVGEVLEKFSDVEFTCEYKYDGERAQIHVMDGGKKIMIFSRNSENMTSKYPDIVARLPACLSPDTKSVVLDGEAVAWDPEKQKILPFQVLSTRARKDVAIADIKVQVQVFVFDCLYLNGESLLQAPLTARREAMRRALRECPGELQFATAKTSRDVEQLELFLSESVEAATEGLIVKTLTDTYEPAKRSSHWLKLKKDYMDGVGDTFDVVPIGAFYGRGKRTGVFGAYLLAVYDPDTERYQTISKLGTGFSEEQLQELADSLRPHIIPEPRKYYLWSDSLAPDVWFEPVKVWEVKCADLSISPVHKAALGLVDAAKGISIRFPRLIRVRDDKGPEDTTSAAQVADMYRAQAVVKAHRQEAGGEDGEEDM